MTVPVLELGRRITLDLAATDRWGGIGIERKVLSDRMGLFGGAGLDVISHRIEGRAGVTFRF